MAVKVALGRLASASFSKALQELMQTRGIPVTASFKLRSLAKTLGDELSKYEETKQDIINQYAEQDEHGNNVVQRVGEREIVKVDPSKLKELNKKLSDLDKVEVSLPGFTFGELGSPELTPEQIYRLDFITEE